MKFHLTTHHFVPVWMKLYETEKNGTKSIRFRAIRALGITVNFSWYHKATSRRRFPGFSPIMCLTFVLRCHRRTVENDGFFDLLKNGQPAFMRFKFLGIFFTTLNTEHAVLARW